MWTYDRLFQKSKIYIRRGIEHENPKSSEIPLWCILSLELLARATLSKISPALLADPQDGKNILFACGFPKDKSPVSIAAKTVFHRCVEICPQFTTKEYDRCLFWINLRNEELHTGALPLSALKTSEWMPEFFRVVKILLDFNSETMESFVGTINLDTTNKMLEAVTVNRKSEVNALIKKFKDIFENLEVESRLEKVRTGKELLARDWYRRQRGQEVKCPSCGGSALVSGELIRSTTPKDENGDFVQEDVMLPVRLQCYCCALELDGYEYLLAIELAEQYVIKDYLDPKDYYGIQFDPTDYVEPEYGND